MRLIPESMALNKESIEKIHNTSLNILENIGIRLLHDKLFEYIQDFDGIKVDKNNKAVGINNNRNNQMKRINEGDKVYMCDNINYYYEGFIKENYKHYENDRLIKENRDIIDIVWGVSHWKWQNNLPKLKRIYISHIDWVKKPLTKEMELYLVKSIKNGGGRIDVQGTVLKLNNLIVK